MTMNLSNEKEEKLCLLAIKDGDEGAFRSLFDRYYETLCGYAFFYSRNKDTANEIVTDAFLKLWQNRLKVDAEIHLKAYLYTMVKNVALNYLRQKKPNHENIEDLNREIISTQQAPDQLMVYNELERSILTCIEELPDRQRKVFKLNRFHNLSYNEIAHLLHISPYTVQEHMINAVKRLKTSFKNVQVIE